MTCALEGPDEGNREPRLRSPDEIVMMLSLATPITFIVVFESAGGALTQSRGATRDSTTVFHENYPSAGVDF